MIDAVYSKIKKHTRGVLSLLLILLLLLLLFSLDDIRSFVPMYQYYVYRLGIYFNHRNSYSFSKYFPHLHHIRVPWKSRETWWTIESRSTLWRQLHGAWLWMKMRDSTWNVFPRHTINLFPFDFRYEAISIYFRFLIVCLSILVLSLIHISEPTRPY